MTDPRNIVIAALASVTLAGASSFVAYWQGHAEGKRDAVAERAREDKAAADAAAKATKAAQAEIDRLTLAAAETETTRQTSVRTIREHTREIIRDPIYSERCLPAGAVGLLDAATATANGERPSVATPAGTASDDSSATPAG